MIFAYSPFRSQERPGQPNGASGTLQKAQEGPMRGPRRAQKGPKRGPRRPQDGPKRGPQRGLRTNLARRPLQNPSGTPPGTHFGTKLGSPRGPKHHRGPFGNPIQMLSGVWKISFSMTAPMLVSIFFHDCANAGFDISGGCQPQRAENGGRPPE